MEMIALPGIQMMLATVNTIDFSKNRGAVQRYREA
jgi:hypothetical protein